MTRRRVAVAAGFALVLAGALAWRAAHRKARWRFETATVDRGPLVAKVTATGTLSALVTVQVGTQVSGRIREVLVDFNSPVRRGALLARIEPQLFQAAVAQAEANVAAARAGVERARAQADEADRQARREGLLAARRLIAPAEREAADSAAAAARAQVAVAEGVAGQARAALEQARVNLACTRITSPTAGVVISRNVDTGQTVAASLQSPTLFVIAKDLARMQVDTSVGEADIGRLRAGMAATFTVDAFPGERFRGTVRQIRSAPQTVQNVVTYDAVVDVDNPDLKLMPGMTANVTFVFAERPQALRVPNAALRFRPPAELAGRLARADGGPAGPGDDPTARAVWVLRGRRTARAAIRTGISDGTMTEVLDGELEAGDACIVDASRGGTGDAADAGGVAAPGGAGRPRKGKLF